MSAAEATAEAAAIELFAIFSSSIFCFSSIVALSVWLSDWISELSESMSSWLPLFNAADCWILLIWLFDSFDCSWRFVSLEAATLPPPQWFPSNFGHFGWWQRIFCGEKRLSGVRGKRPSLRCWYWYLTTRWNLIYDEKNGRKGEIIAKLKVKIRSYASLSKSLSQYYINSMYILQQSRRGEARLTLLEISHKTK